MWVSDNFINHPPVITINNHYKPFPVMGGLLEFTFYIPTLTHSLPKSISRLHASQPSSTSDSVMGSKASQASFFSQGPEAGPAFDVWSSTCLPSGRERNSMARTKKKSGKIRSCLKLSTYNYIHTIILTFHSIYSIALPYTTYIMCIYIYTCTKTNQHQKLPKFAVYG